jgi:hypothetical protein
MIPSHLSNDFVPLRTHTPLMVAEGSSIGC